MLVISRKPLSDFASRYPVWKEVINDWWKKAEDADWNNFADVKETFNSVDAIGDSRYVFNIGGNNIRLIGMIFFKIHKLFIRGVFTHQEYDSLNAGGKIKTL